MRSQAPYTKGEKKETQESLCELCEPMVYALLVCVVHCDNTAVRCEHGCTALCGSVPVYRHALCASVPVCVRIISHIVHFSGRQIFEDFCYLNTKANFESNFLKSPSTPTRRELGQLISRPLIDIDRQWLARRDAAVVHEFAVADLGFTKTGT